MAIDFLPQTDWKPTAGLGGAIEGMRTGLGMQDFDKRQLALSLANQAKLLQNQQEQADEDLWKGSERVSKDATNRYTADDILSGRKLARDTANLDQVTSSTEANRASTKQKKITDSEENHRKVEALANEIYTANPQGVKDPYTRALIKERFANLGVNLPDDEAQVKAIMEQLAHNHTQNQDRQKETRSFDERITLQDRAQSNQNYRAELAAKSRVDQAKEKMKKFPNSAEAAIVERLYKEAEAGERTWTDVDRLIADIVQGNQDKFTPKLNAAQGTPTPTLAEKVSAPSKPEVKPAATMPKDVNARTVGGIYYHPGEKRNFKYKGMENGEIKAEWVD